MSSIEYTPELLIFDLLGVHLYHGWLVSPDDHELRHAVQSFSYNQLVEFIITNSSDAHAAAPSPPSASPSASASASAADAASSSPPSASASASASASGAVSGSASASGQSAGASAAPPPASDPAGSGSGSSGSSAAGSSGAPDARQVGRAMLCHEFLDQTASQLTFAGISELQVRV